MSETSDLDESDDPLDKLIVDENKVNRELLASILDGLVTIGKESGQIIRQPPFDELVSKQQVAVLLLAHRVRYERDLIESEWASPAELAEESGMASGTVRPKIRELAKDDIAEENDSEYRIPPHRFQQVQRLLENGDNS